MRIHYKRLLAESRFREHMLRRELAEYSVVPGWAVKLFSGVKKVKKAIDTGLSVCHI